MRIFLACSKHFYDRIPAVKQILEIRGHSTIMPNSFDEPFKEEEMKQLGADEHAGWKRMMLRRDEQNIRPCDAILVLNYEKRGQPNYIGGATFLEINKAFELEKKIFLMNPVPDGIFTDELKGMGPVVLYGKLEKVM
ncbi:hypothetical protein JW898_01605 [Candidatus Woesearchaeota archaeon]|nr:hypothetical protein [Candidatus Woesearchaeota archaeon]